MVTRSDPSFPLPPTVGPPTIVHGHLPEEGASFSGHERDKLFLNVGGGQFKDISGVSGADDPGDGRVFALLDFDRDGFWDIAEINANAPSLKLYQNRFGADPGWRAAHNMIALRFVGANRQAKPARDKSNRDGFGALVTIDLGDTKLLREHRAGEGFAGQNSTTMLVGIGAHRVARRVTVRWPSGKTQSVEAVPANRLVTVRELGSGGKPFEMAQYTGTRALAWGRTPADGTSASARVSIDLPADAGDPPVRVFTTFATWCQACQGDLPQFARLKESFPDGQLGLFAVPIDENDDRSKLEQWVATHHPAYTMLTGLAPEQPAALKRFAAERLRHEALPSTVVAQRDGTVLEAMAGVPTVSDLRMLGIGARYPR